LSLLHGNNMQDVFNTPAAQKGDIQIFYGTAISNATNWQIWRKPGGVSIVKIFAVGGGGNGGNGFVGATAAAGGGGGAAGRRQPAEPLLCRDQA
jgi:hypothetical protein